MLRLKKITGNDVAVLEARGKLTKADYDKLLPELESALERHGSLRFYIELHDFSGAEMAALKQDALFDIKHKDSYGSMAIVGDRSWQKWATKLSSLFFDAPVRFYDVSDAESAWEWVNGS